MRFVLALLFVATLHGAELPDAPPHGFWNSQQIAAQSFNAGMRFADAGLTCSNIANGGRELWMPVKSCSGVAGVQAGVVALSVIGAAWFERHHHHRLAVAIPWVLGVSDVAGVARSARGVGEGK